MTATKRATVTYDTDQDFSREWEFDGWTNVNKWLCENGHAVGYWGQNKDDVKGEHWKNRELLAEQGVHELLPWDED